MFLPFIGIHRYIASFKPVKCPRMSRDFGQTHIACTSEGVLPIHVHVQTHTHKFTDVAVDTMRQWDWLVMNIFCKRKHSESGYGSAASAVLRVLHFKTCIGARPLVLFSPFASNDAIIPPPTSYAPSLPSPFLSFLASLALFSIQETWLQPAYFMRPASARVPIHPSIHPWWIRLSIAGYNLTLHFLRRCQDLFLDLLAALPTSALKIYPRSFPHDDIARSFKLLRRERAQVSPRNSLIKNSLRKKCKK